MKRVLLIGSVTESSTGNPGDNLIRQGVENLIRTAFAGVSFVRLSKFDVPARQGKRLRWVKLMNWAELIVIAGTPQWNRLSDWCFPYDAALYTEILFRSDTPLMMLGGGGGGRATNPRSFAQYLSRCALTVRLTKEKIERSILVTARDPYAYEWLTTVSDAPKIHHRPCPSFYAAPVRQPVAKYERLVLCPTTPHASGREWMRRWKALEEMSPHPVTYVVHTASDLLRIAPHVGDNIRLATSYLEMVDAYRDAWVVTSRLHGAVAAALGGSAVALVRVDLRASTCRSVDSILLVDQAFKAGDVLSAMERLAPLDPDAIQCEFETDVRLVREAARCPTES